MIGPHQRSHPPTILLRRYVVEGVEYKIFGAATTPYVKDDGTAVYEALLEPIYEDGSVEMNKFFAEPSHKDIEKVT